MGLTRKQVLMVTICVLGTLVASVNQTIMIPVMPKVMVDMAIDAATVQWLTTGFTLMNAIMIPITAFLIDRFSVRSLFAASMAMFVIGSAMSGSAPGFAVLLIGRLIQAMGAGILTPLAMTVLLRAFPVERRGTAMGLYGIVVAAGPAVGPTVSGALVDAIGWQLMFYVVAACALAVCPRSLFLLDNEKSMGKNVKLDIPSVVLSCIGFGTFLYGLSAIGSSGIGFQSIVGLVVGAVVLVFFFYRQVTVDEPMLRVRILANKRFLISTIEIMLIQAALMGASVLLPIYTQNDLGFSALQSGLVVLPGSLLMAAVSPLSGRLFDRYGPRALVIIGLLVLMVGTGAFVFFDDSCTMVYIMLVYAVRYIGLSLANTPVNTWGMNALPDEVINHGSSVVNTFRQVADSFGTAVLVTVYSMVTASSTSSMGEIQASIHGYNVAFVVSVALCLVGIVLAVVFVKGKAPEQEKADASEQ